MARVVAQFEDLFEGADGYAYKARACCRQNGHTWEGWIEFVPVAGGHTLRTARETTQPNLQDMIYWASGLTQIYLEGALRRAEGPVPAAPVPLLPEEPAYPGPRHAILDPFSVFAKGEDILRDELSALARRHLVAIVEDFALAPHEGPVLAAQTEAELVESIVSAVKERTRRAA